MNQTRNTWSSCQARAAMAERKKGHSHRIPVIDRMMTVLEALEGRRAGATVADLAQALRIPRTTVYRILNTLEGHRMVAKRSEDGGYVLGTRFVRFARFVPELVDIAAAARPTLEALAERVHETAKLSIREGDDAVVVAVVQSPGGYAISTRVGRRFPLHAG